LKKGLDNFFKAIQEKVEGTVKIKSYEGSCIIIGKESDKSLYWQELATFEEDTLYDQSDAEGFINLFRLPLKVEGLKLRKL